MECVIKRDGTKVPFDKSKIVNAIEKAMTCTPGGIDARVSNAIADYIADMPDILSVEQIQDIVVDSLKNSPFADVAEAYSQWRKYRQEIREKEKTNASILDIIDIRNDAINQENSNKNPTVNSVQRDYMAGEVSKELTERLLLPKDILDAHKAGIIHVHDTDYFVQHMHNCDLVNLEDMLQNGTVISGTGIDRPHSFSTACNIATQIVAQVASNQYGGQSITLSHLAPFVDVSRKKIEKEVHQEFYDMVQNNEIDKMPEKETINRIVEERLHKEIARGVQTIQYQVITLMTTNGQAPFITVFMYLDEVPEGQTRDDLAVIIEEMLKQRIQGVKNETGAWITPAFPKLIYVLDEDNIYPDSKYYYLTELAAKCTAKRMVPDYISAKVMKELKGGVWVSMGCRSFLTPDRTTENVANAKNWVKGHKYYGRFNQGVVTINLVDVACSSEKDKDKFWKIFDERLELCHRALQIRHKRLLGTVSDMSPIHWQYGALARLKKGEKIDKLLFGGYSTISLGYAGLYECVKYMTGKSHTDSEAKPFALEIMQHMNDMCAEWKKAENMDYSLYGTPLESTTYKFAKCLQKRFGIIPEVTDHEYITNSYHVNVREHIDAFTKLKFESEFQKLSPGGAISYVEVPNMQQNIPAVISVMKFIYDNIMYAELNTKSDYCQVCGYDGEIKIVEDNGKLVWECPNCGNRDQNKMNVARRTCGYVGSHFWNQGRTQEIRDRVVHLSDN
ncbi:MULTISPECIES: anaerobic ribonucleoside-triphosphate reductase [Faecalibacterium]|jgi:ribonucleoside-triphosphate reductase|uniref:anaerobic ribonucleoside-triphosphate reductase n=1 Tax=Faecalibacterium TaxID=216851 RepID=UPI000E4D19EE|nr:MULTISPECIES: anaerobic ribonucleoside-triphosphate reductase [Faecalibacterium]RHQ27548.1 anaerobic ribonucleoside-triphosphate reductase [Faecalibacterium sp. AF28-13AC]